MMLYFNQVSLVGIPANFFIVPLIGFVVVPLGLLAVFLYPLCFLSALWCMHISSAVLGYAVRLVCYFADLPFAAVKTATPTYFEICCYYLLAWALLNIKNVQPGSFFNRKKLAKAVMAAVILAAGFDVYYWVNKRFFDEDLRVTMIDVGQGSSALLEFPKGFVMLIDGGGFSDNAIFDVGAFIIAPYLWQKKIKTVDTIILSHPESDHLNGLIYIAKHFNVKTIWTNGEVANTYGYKQLAKIVAGKKINMPTFRDLSRKHDINGVGLEILYPECNFLNKKKKEKWRNINNNSLVVRVAYNAKSFLFPGDIMAKAEKELVAIAGKQLESTVLIAPHHGSKTSSTRLFLEKVKPEIVIISSGRNSRLKHPDPLVLKRYQKLGYKIFCTSQNGALAMSTDGSSLITKVFYKWSRMNRKDK